MSLPLIAHIEIPSTDLDKSKEFYKNLFGWEFKPFGTGYYLFNNYKGIMVGLRQAEKIMTGDATRFHVLVEDIDAVLKKAGELGGKTERAKTVIPAMGYYALLSDDIGNVIGLYQKN